MAGALNFSSSSVIALKIVLVALCHSLQLGCDIFTFQPDTSGFCMLYFYDGVYHPISISFHLARQMSVTKETAQRSNGDGQLWFTNPDAVSYECYSD